jgi:hypothetical protein
MRLFSLLVPVLLISVCTAALGQTTPPPQPQMRTGIAAGTPQAPANTGQTNQPQTNQTKTSSATTRRTRTAAKPTPTPVPVPTPVPSPTPMEATKPSDMPPVPPQVTFRNGLLTVNAVNSTLSSLLTAIRNKTGIEFEGAELAGQDRVAISMGPASEGEVLASILSGSSLDYVVMGRPDSPTIVQKVLLTRRSKPGAPAVANGQQTPAANAQQEGDEEGQDENAAEEQQPQDTAAQPPVQQQPQGQAQPQQTPADPNAQPKTPEQLLQELKEMQQKQSGQTPDPNSAPRKVPPRM